MSDPISRADFLRKGFKMFAKELGKAINDTVKEKADKFIAPQLRPPGAIAELSFLMKCTRCNACVQACPHNAITQADEKNGSAMGTPIIIPSSQVCMMCKDFPCIAACPSGALAPDAPRTIGTAYINRLKCFAYTGQICDYCHDCCPEKNKAITLENNKPVINAHHCTGCGLCEFYCPAQGKAVQVLPSHHKQGKQAS